MAKKINKSIYFMFYIMPIVESLNGFFVRLPISDMYRIILILLITYSILCKNKIYTSVFQALFLIGIFIVLTILQLLVFHGNLIVFKNDLNTVLRILLLPVYISYFKASIQTGDLTKRDFSNMLRSYSFQYMILVIIPYLLGGGLSTYDIDNNSITANVSETSVGCKGYFIEVNSLVAILTSMMIYSGEVSWREKFYNNFFSFSSAMFWNCLGNIWALFIVATKTGIVVAILYLIFFLLRFLFKAEVFVEIKLALVFLIFFFGQISIDHINSFFSDILSRGKYFYNLFGGDLIRFLTSSRSVYLKNTIEEINNSSDTSILTVIGGGYYVNFFKSYEGYKRSVIEMDWFDFYFSYGIVGVISYINYLKSSIVNYFFSNKEKQIKIIITVFLFYSFFAGHIFFNAMTVTILSVCFVCLDSTNLMERKYR